MAMQKSLWQSQKMNPHNSKSAISDHSWKKILAFGLSEL